jgi:hypothetical protein
MPSRVSFAALALAGAAALASTAAHAGGHVSLSVGINAFPGAVAAPVYVQPAPVYVQPAPLYAQPQAVYVQPNVYAVPPVVYTQPAVVYPPTVAYVGGVYVGGGPRWHHHHWR